MAGPKRTAQIVVRLRPHERELLERAAATRLCSISELVRDATVALARSIVPERKVASR